MIFFIDYFFKGDNIKYKLKSKARIEKYKCLYIQDSLPMVVDELFLRIKELEKKNAS